MSVSEIITRTTTNPLRSEVLKWYRKCMKSAFEIDWSTTHDALYVLKETRKLFRQNEHLREVADIQRKLREVEMRYELAVHYKIPYPRPYYKAHGGIPNSPTEYIPYMDTSFDGYATNPMIAPVEEGRQSALYSPKFDYNYTPDADMEWRR